MSNYSIIPIIIFLAIINGILVSAYDVPTNIVSSRQDGLEINTSLNYNAFNGITEIYNFSATNYNSSSIKWDLPFFIHLEGVEFYEWEAKKTNRINRTQIGTEIIEHNHNGTLENHTQPTFLFELEEEYSWEPAKQFLTNTHSKYGKKVNASSSINIGAGETKYFWARFKTVFAPDTKKFDISHLDPFISAQLYRGGDGAGDFTSDINKTLSEPINATATIITIGIDAGTAALSRIVDETFENNSIVQWDSSENGGSAGCQVTTANALNGSYNLNYTTAVNDLACIRRPQDYSKNGEGFNVSFNFRWTTGDWHTFGFRAGDNITAGSIGQRFNRGSLCPANRFCFTNKVEWDTGLDCNAGNTCQMIMEVNATKGGSTANETTVWLWVNGTRSGNFTSAIGVLTMDYFSIQTSGTIAFLHIDDLEIINSSGVGADTNATTAGYVRSNKFTHSTTIRRLSYNSSETGTADGLVFNFTCNDYGGTWSQGGGDNRTRQGENTFIDCPVLGLIFAYDVNISQQQDLIQLNISTIDNTVPSSNNTLWNQTVGFGVYTRVNVLNATVNVNEPNGDEYNVTFNWSRSNVNLRFVNISGSGGAAAQFSDNLNIQTLLKGDTVRIDTFVQDSRSLDGHSGMKTNTTIIADFPVELVSGPSFNKTFDMTADNNVAVNLTFREEDPGDNVSVQVTWSRANSHNNVSNNLFSFINTTTNVTSQVNLTLLEGNFSGGDNVSFQIVLNSSASTLGNFTANSSNWFIINTRVGTPNFTNGQAQKIDSSPFEFNWTGAVDALSAETNITYRFEYANDGGDDWVNLNTSHPETNFTWSFRGTSGLRFNTTYRFRARAEFGVNYTDYNLTGNITLGQNSTTINASTVSIIGNDQIIGRYGIGSNVTIQANITPGLLTNISYVNFTVYYPNGSLHNVSNNASITSEGFLVNSSHRFELRTGGTYTWKINATNTEGNTTTAESTLTVNGLFTVADNYFVNPGQQLLKVIDPAERLLFNFSIYHSSVENITFNISVSMSNTTAFNTSFQYTSLDVNGSVHNASNPALFILQVNATDSTALRDDEYLGNITIRRMFDRNTTIIPIIFGVNPPRGEITMQSNGANPQAQCNSIIGNCFFSTTLEGGQQGTKTWRINNTGAFNLTGCGAHFYDAASGQNLTLTELNPVLSITGVDTTNPDNTSIRPNATATLQLDIGPDMAVGAYTSHIDVNCRATRFGFTDAASAQPNELPYLSVTVTGATGSAAGGLVGGFVAPVVKPEELNVTLPLLTCGDQVCGADLGENFFNCRADCQFDFDLLLTGQILKEAKGLRYVAFIALGAVLVVAFFTPKKTAIKAPKPHKNFFT